MTCTIAKFMSMELLFWFLGFFSKPFVVFVFLLVIIVMLDAAGKRRTEEKENLDRKKNGVEETKLDNEGLKVGTKKKSKKEKRVKFADDVVVRKANDVEVSEKPVKDFELSENMYEKVGFLANLSEGRLVVERGEGSKVMEDVGDVVVRKVDHFDGSDKPLKVLELSDDMSEKIGCLDRLLEEGLDLARGEGSKIVTEVHQFEAGGVDKESEVLICGEKSVGECGHVNIIRDAKGAGAEGKRSKNLGLLVEALDRRIADEKNEIAIIGDYCGVKGEDAVNSGLEGFVVEQEIKIDADSSEDVLIWKNDNVSVEECNAANGKKVANDVEFFKKELETKALDGENGLYDALIDENDAAIRERAADTQLSEGALEREAADGENGMVLMNDAVVTDESDTVVGKNLANGDEVLEEKFDGEAVDSENGITLINCVVQIDESDAAGGERVAGKAKLSDENLEREVFEEKCEDTAGDLDKVYGGEECNIHLVTNGLENLAVEEVMKHEEFCSESKVELVRDIIAYPQSEAGGVKSDNTDDKTGVQEGFSGVDPGEEAVVRDKDVGHNVYDDDWEGVERSELEKVFAEAVNYVEYGRKTKDDQLRSDVLMRLYGLHKLAVEGPCHGPQPMALKFSARARWNAWQSLGSMSPEDAMEEYIKILSDTDPGWTQFSSAEDDKHGSIETRTEGDTDTRLTSYKDPQACSQFGRKPEVNPVPDGNSLTEQTS